MKHAIAVGVVLVSLCMSGRARADDAVDPSESADPFSAMIAATASSTSQLDAKHGPGAAFTTSGEGGWCTGKPAKGASPDGVGQTLTLTFAKPYTATQLVIDAGLWTKGKPSKTWSMPTQLTVALDGGAATTVAVADGTATVALTKPVTTVVIGFAAVKKGKKRVSCLSNVAFSDAKAAVAIVSDPKAIATLESDATAIGAAWKACKADPIGAVATFPLVETMTIQGQRKPTLTHLKSAAALVARKCIEPAWIGEPSNDGNVVMGECDADGVDRLACSANFDGGRATWTLAWAGGHWKIAALLSAVNNIE